MGDVTGVAMACGRTWSSSYRGAVWLVLALLTWPAVAFADDDLEPAAILEFGGAGQWGLAGGAAYGPGLAVETTPIENWLELEAGVTPLFSRARTEWDVDFLFKKPFTLSGTVELMVGVGP